MNSAPHQILVVEDNPAIAHVVRFNLQRAGCEVATAQNGREGLERLLERPFDLVITDQQMPVLDGWSFCQEMRQVERYVATPIIMLTAKGFELDVVKLREELGITLLFPKPFSPAELVQAVQDCLAPAT